MAYEERLLLPILWITSFYSGIQPTLNSPVLSHQFFPTTLANHFCELDLGLVKHSGNEKI